MHIELQRISDGNVEAVLWKDGQQVLMEWGVSMTHALSQLLDHPSIDQYKSADPDFFDRMHDHQLNDQPRIRIAP